MLIYITEKHYLPSFHRQPPILAMPHFYKKILIPHFFDFSEEILIPL